MPATPQISFPYISQIAAGQPLDALPVWQDLLAAQSSYNAHTHDPADVSGALFTAAGADIASASAITVTAPFHKITGTVTIATINLSGATKGNQVTLWFASALTISNGTGNILTQSGSDLSVSANGIVTFVFDGSNWRQVGIVQASPTTYTWATLPINPGAEGTLVHVADSLIGMAGIWTLEYKPSADATYPYRGPGGNALAPAVYDSIVKTAAGNFAANLASWVTPVAGVADFKITEHVGDSSAGGSGFTAKLGTTNGGSEIGSVSAAGPPGDVKTTTVTAYTFAKAVTHYFNYAAVAPNYFSSQDGATLQMFLKKCAGNV